MKLCHKCDLDFPDTYKFCRACGGGLIKVRPTENETTLPCPNCNAPMNAECQFCRECGTEVAKFAVKALATAGLVSEMASGLKSNWMRLYKGPLQSPLVGSITGDVGHSQCSSCNNTIDEGKGTCQFCGQNRTRDPSSWVPGSLSMTTGQLSSPAGSLSDQASFTVPTSTVPLPSFHQFDRWQEESTNTTSVLTLDQRAKEAVPVWRKSLLSFAAAAVVLLTLAVVLGFSYWSSPKASLIAKSHTTPTAVVSPTPSSPTPPEGMIYVPRGNFKMGRDDGDEYERPTHEVSVAPFYIDKFEVTREAYQKFIDATGYPAPPGWPNGRYPDNTARLPVTGVNWVDANAYAQWAGKRLPTEEEWEYAARGQDNRLYPWGNEWRPNAANAGRGHGDVAQVGSYPAGASPFGVLDMVGNVWEWTGSELRAYEGSRIKEDKLPEARRRNLKVIRGGCYLNKTGPTTTFRMGWDVQQATDYAQTGFRCAQGTRK